MIILHYGQLCSAPSTLVIVASVLYGQWKNNFVRFSLAAILPHCRFYIVWSIRLSSMRSICLMLDWDRTVVKCTYIYLHTLPIHVNPPSFVRSLRHFDIAENLRPGDENLRHLTVTSRFKKLVYFWQSEVKTQPHFRAFSTFYFSAGAQSSKVGEIMWLARMRDYILGL